jgi:hypothetical protein
VAARSGCGAGICGVAEGLRAAQRGSRRAAVARVVPEAAWGSAGGAGRRRGAAAEGLQRRGGAGRRPEAARWQPEVTRVVRGGGVGRHGGGPRRRGTWRPGVREREATARRGGEGDVAGGAGDGVG